MNLQKYIVRYEKDNPKAHFISQFKSLMCVDVKSIICIDTLMQNVEPVGDMPVGFVLSQASNFYLVGWTDSKKRCHPFNLYPHRKVPVQLYGMWIKRDWSFGELYKCVFQRIRQLEDPPTVVASINNWEDNRQALFSCAKIIGESIVKKVKAYELKMVEVITKDNDELLNSICSDLKLSPSVDKLKQYIGSLYESEIEFTSKEIFKESGILTLIEDATSKWNI